MVVLMFLVAAGFYFIGSPSSRVMESELARATANADLRSIAECTAGAQTAAIEGLEYGDICIEQYAVQTKFICLNERQTITPCEIVRNRKPAFSFIVSSTGLLPDASYNNMLEILESDYPNSGAFGIFRDNVIMAGGGTGTRPVPAAIIKDAALETGQLVYMTQFEMPDPITEFTAAPPPNVNCPAGTIQTYRFGRWQCVMQNEKITCTGDYIWDTDMGECVPDESRRPLCSMNQTAVMVEDVWECVDPFTDRECPAG
jgi:hypothetical protein